MPHSLEDLSRQVDEMRAQMGDQVGPFPEPMIGAYLSHFIIAFEFLAGDKKGQILSVVSPPASQSVSWSKAFTYDPQAKHEVSIQVPDKSGLPGSIKESDFVQRPNDYFRSGKETMWLQILNLDARMETELGPIRIILGSTMKREYPEIFQPSLGAAQALGEKGFPARLFFNPIAVVETPFGKFRATHGTLSYGRVHSFPPIGTPVTISDMVPLEPVDAVRELAAQKRLSDVVAMVPARIVALSHPIDVGLQFKGDEAYHAVERAIAAK